MNNFLFGFSAPSELRSSMWMTEGTSASGPLMDGIYSFILYMPMANMLLAFWQ